MRHEKLAEAISFSPALQRLYTVFRLNLLPVMPAKTIAQRECVLHGAGRDGGLRDHLRFDLRALVRTEQGVIDEVAVVARDIGGRPNGIDDLQVGLRHEPESLAIVLGADRRCTQRHSGGRRRGASEYLSATNAVHPSRSS